MTLVRVACLRWPVEEGLCAKGHFGLDRSPVRLCTAYLRLIVLTMAEIKRRFILVTHRTQSQAHRLGWNLGGDGAMKPEHGGFTIALGLRRQAAAT